MDNSPQAPELRLSYLTYDPENYEQQLEAKISSALSILGLMDKEVPLTVCRSPRTNYRHRCRFGIGDDGNQMWYTMWECGAPTVRLLSYPLGSIFINSAMVPLLQIVTLKPPLRTELRAVHFLSTTKGDLLITMIYEKALNDEWCVEATILFRELAEQIFTCCRLVGIRGRSKGVKYVIGDENVFEQFQLQSGQIISYVQIPDGFSNPNPEVNVQALNWICRVVEAISTRHRSKGTSLDFLELYCGNGNHTVALSVFARYVVAVEINRLLCEAAESNLKTNCISNVDIVSCDSQKFASHILRKMTYMRKNGEECHFSGVLVDPPRAGLDSTTLRLVKGYQDIIYISCNPDALARDLLEVIPLSMNTKITSYSFIILTRSRNLQYLINLRTQPIWNVGLIYQRCKANLSIIFKIISSHCSTSIGRVAMSLLGSWGGKERSLDDDLSVSKISSMNSTEQSRILFEALRGCGTCLYLTPGRGRSPSNSNDPPIQPQSSYREDLWIRRT